MLIKKYKQKIISNNIQSKQSSSSASTSTLPQRRVVTAAKIDGSLVANRHHVVCQQPLSLHHLRRHHGDEEHDDADHHHNDDLHHRIRRRMCYLSSVAAVVVLGVTLLPLPPPCDAVGYSYTRFRGPVSGPEHRIYVRGGDHRNEESHLDYVAKPEYEFAYGVEDAQAHILHNRNEVRDGDSVKGVYSVVDPDGALRIVKYTADDSNGFQAEVIRNGISAIHGQLQADTPTTISHQDISNNNNNGYHNYQQPTNVYSPDHHNQYHYHPSYQYPTATVNHGTPSTPISDYSSNPNYYNNNDGNTGVDNANDYVDNQDYRNEGEYRPQYEVHEEANNDESDNEDTEDQYDGEDPNKKKVTSGDKKKDHHDDGDEDDDSDGDDDDDYDDSESEELEDYDDAVKPNDESDEYY